MNSPFYSPADGLALESGEDAKQKYVFNWLLMPLTRAIDTLCITLQDPNSLIGKLLHRVALKMPDVVVWDM